MAKSEKLFEILEHINRNPNLAPKDLASLCSVSERAIYRYLNTLSKVGISIQFQDGGYKMKGGYANILSKADPEGLEAVRLLLMAGMRACDDEQALEHGGEFLEMIESRLPGELQEIRIVPEQVRAVSHGGTLTIGHSSRPDIINPILTSETISVTLMNLIFSGLVRFDQDRMPVPDLARYWDISRDGLTWTFFIREDVCFHDGHPLTAHDVEFTYRAIMDPGNMSPRAKRYGPVDRLSTEGDYIFRMFLKHPFMPLMSRLGWPVAPRHLLEHQEFGSTPFNRHPVGTGPFRLAEWREDDTIVLDANSEYFRKDRPILDRLVFRQYPDRASVLQAISRGEMDIALNLTASDLLFVGRSGSFRVYPVSSPFYYALIFNLRDPLFRDIKVRKAMDHTIDKASIARKLRGYECSGPFDAGSWAYNSHVKPTPCSPERARELLEQAGWRSINGVLNKDGKPFEVTIGVPNASDVMERIASSIKAQLAEVGIHVKLSRMDDSELFTHGTPFQAIVAMIASGTDPEYARRTWHSGSGRANLASYRNSFVDDLMDLGRQTAELEKRKAIYHKVHEMIHDDCPAIFLASAYEYIGSRYQFRDRFTSTMHFLSTIRDWHICHSILEKKEIFHEESLSAE